MISANVVEAGLFSASQDPSCRFTSVLTVPAGRLLALARMDSVKYTRVIVAHYGGPDVLQVLEEECPEPGRGEVRVRVLAAGVSLPDIMAREGVLPETPRVPYTPGWDLVGVVDRLGDGVTG